MNYIVFDLEWNQKPLPASDQKWGHHPHLYRDALYGKTIF